MAKKPKLPTVRHRWLDSQTERVVLDKKTKKLARSEDLKKHIEEEDEPVRE